MYRRKRRDYDSYLHELEVEQGVAYRPMVWSAFGRAHPETQAMLTSLAIQAARRRGLRDHSLLLRRVRGAIGVALARRAVRMVLSCLPHLDAAEGYLLLGASGGASPRPQLRPVAMVDGEADCRAGSV